MGASQTVNFTIAAPPKTTIVSPQNQTYDIPNIPLIFTVDKATDWTGYSIDNMPSVTINGNTTIANLTAGLHSITVYANSLANVRPFQTINFTVAKPTAQFSTMTVTAVSGVTAVIIIVAGLVVYFKKHKR